jgi:hypothetical protein
MMMMSAMVVDEKLPGQFASKRFISILPQSAGFLVLGYPPAVGRGRQYNVSLDSISTSFLHAVSLLTPLYPLQTINNINFLLGKECILDYAFRTNNRATLLFTDPTGSYC